MGARYHGCGQAAGAAGDARASRGLPRPGSSPHRGPMGRRTRPPRRPSSSSCTCPTCARRSPRAWVRVARRSSPVGAATSSESAPDDIDLRRFRAARGPRPAAGGARAVARPAARRRVGRAVRRRGDQPPGGAAAGGRGAGDRPGPRRGPAPRARRELEALVLEEPLRETLHAQRMLALYRSGRQADALSAFRQVRTALVDQIGVEPGAELRRLHEAILRQDPALEPDRPPQPAARAAPELELDTSIPLVGRDLELDACASGGAVRSRARAGSSCWPASAGSGKTVWRPSWRSTSPVRAAACALRAALARRHGRPSRTATDAGRPRREDAADLDELGEVAQGSPVLVLATLAESESERSPTADAAGVGRGDPPADAARRRRRSRGGRALRPAGADVEIPVERLMAASGGVPPPSTARRRPGAARRPLAASATPPTASRAERPALRGGGGRPGRRDRRARGGPRARRPDGGGGPGRRRVPVQGAGLLPGGGRPLLLRAATSSWPSSSPASRERRSRGSWGPRGAGKSSVLRAGLLAALADGVLPGSERWPIALLRPGEHPGAGARAGDRHDRAPRRFPWAARAGRRPVRGALHGLPRRGRARGVRRRARRRAHAIPPAATLVLLASAQTSTGAAPPIRTLPRCWEPGHVLVGRCTATNCGRRSSCPPSAPDCGSIPRWPMRSWPTSRASPVPCRCSRRRCWSSGGTATGACCAWRTTSMRAASTAPSRGWPSAPTSGSTRTSAAWRRRVLLRLAEDGEGGVVVRRRVALDEFESPAAMEVLAVLADDRLVDRRPRRGGGRPRGAPARVAAAARLARRRRRGPPAAPAPHPRLPRLARGGPRPGEL
jgi:hypothetical protein